MALGATTGTYNFSTMYASDMTLEVFERIGWRAASLTTDMMMSAQRSFNFVQSRWSNLGVNLWEVTLHQFPLVPGTATYTLPQPTISILPAAYIRTNSLGVTTNEANPFSTVSGSKTVTVTQALNAQAIGNIINVATPIAVGGIVIYGYYTVDATPTVSTYTFQAANVATSTSAVGVSASFMTTLGSSSVTITLTNQPFLVGAPFNVQVPVTVGGLTLQGSYIITSASTNSFTIAASSNATSTTSATMNSGQAQIQTITPGAAPTDRVLYPLGRDDYSSLAAKTTAGLPTSYWFNRQSTPTITFWPIPDSDGPYQFNYYALSQIQDASLQSGAGLDVPYRFLEAYAAAVAAHLAMKWRPDIFPALTAYADKVWIEASDADREEVSFYVAPDFSGYFQG